MRPGIDPRTWITLATVVAYHLDDEHGPFVDISILTDMTVDDNGAPVDHVETARITPMYAGSGFGFYAPIEVGDEVVVGYPNGNPDHGLVVIGRCWSEIDPPPSLAVDNPVDICLQVKKDVNLRIQVFGSGNVVLGSEDGKVLLGEESATRGVARIDDTAKASELMATWMGQVEGVANGIAPGAVAPLSTVFASNPGIAVINSASDKVKSV